MTKNGGVHTDTPEGYAVPDLLMTHVVLRLNATKII